MKRHLVAVDIGGSKTAVMARAVGSDRKAQRQKYKTPASGGVGAMLALLDEHVDELPGGRASVAAMGVAVPGHVDPNGHVVCAGNLEGWVDVPLREQLEERYRVPVFVEGDANCGALGEKWLGAAKELNDFVFLALGTGVGAGVFVNGSLHRGAHAAAGEVGDMTFPRVGRDKGPARTLASVLGKRALKRVVQRETGKKLTAADALHRAAKDKRFERLTREFIEYLSTSVVAISSLLDPEAIIFGGGTSKAGEALLKRVREAVAPNHVVRARLMLAGLGSEAQLYGALWGAQAALASSQALDAVEQLPQAAT